MTGNNTNLDLVHIKHLENLGEKVFGHLFSRYCAGKKNLTSIKGRKSVINEPKNALP